MASELACLKQGSTPWESLRYVLWKRWWKWSLEKLVTLAARITHGTNYSWKLVRLNKAVFFKPHGAVAEAAWDLQWVQAAGGLRAAENLMWTYLHLSGEEPFLQTPDQRWTGWGCVVKEPLHLGRVNPFCSIKPLPIDHVELTTSDHKFPTLIILITFPFPPLFNLERCKYWSASIKTCQ